MHFKLPSAIRLNLDQANILSSGNGLTKISFEKTEGKTENSISQPLSSCLTANFYTPHYTPPKMNVF